LFGVFVTIVLPVILIPVVVVKMVDLLKQDIYNSLPGVHERGLVAQVDSVLPSPPKSGMQTTFPSGESGEGDVSGVGQTGRFYLVADFVEIHGGKLDCPELLKGAESPILIVRPVAGKPGQFEVAVGHLADKSPPLGKFVERPTGEEPRGEAQK
jgi:hypothetical protein